MYDNKTEEILLLQNEICETYIKDARCVYVAHVQKVHWKFKDTDVTCFFVMANMRNV